MRATAVSLLDECNFEARHIMRVSGHKSKSSIRSYSRRLSEVKQKEISHALSSACSAENLESTSTQIVAMHEQTSENSLGRNTVPNSPVCFASHSQETANFHANAFSGANVTINFYNSKWLCFKSIFYFFMYFETFQRDWRVRIKKLYRLWLFVFAIYLFEGYRKVSIYNKALNVWSLGKLVSFVFPRDHTLSVYCCLPMVQE